MKISIRELRQLIQNILRENSLLKFYPAPATQKPVTPPFPGFYGAPPSNQDPPPPAFPELGRPFPINKRIAFLKWFDALGQLGTETAEEARFLPFYSKMGPLTNANNAFPLILEDAINVGLINLTTIGSQSALEVTDAGYDFLAKYVSEEYLS